MMQQWGKVVCLFFAFVHVFAAAEDKLTSEQEAYYYPELSSPAYSPDLSYADIKIIRQGLTAAFKSMGGSVFSTTGDPIGLLQPYIEDKRNIEARYAYAAVLSDNPLGLGIERALPIYIELASQGWPPALRVLKKKQELVCELPAYKEQCAYLNYNEILRLAYLKWASKDPLHVHMYRETFYLGGIFDEDESILSPAEIDSLATMNEDDEYTQEYGFLLKEAMSKGCYYCSFRNLLRYTYKIQNHLKKKSKVEKALIENFSLTFNKLKEDIISAKDWEFYSTRWLYSGYKLSIDPEYRSDSDAINHVIIEFGLERFTEKDVLRIFKHRSERGFSTEFYGLKYASFMPTNNLLINDLLSYEAKEKLTQAYNGSRGIGIRYTGNRIMWPEHQKWLDDQDPDRLEEALDLIKIKGLFK